MDHLNYFKPYNSKEADHEDNLTRAFLATIRISLLAQTFFFDYLREEILKKSAKAEFPAISKIKHNDVYYETQKASENSDFAVSKLFSVLISDEKIKTERTINTSSRVARYDGLIYINQDIAIVIENKPYHKNVWEDQLRPNIEKDFPEVKDGLFPYPIELEWKEIIKRFTNILEIRSINRADGAIIDDFLNYVDDLYPELNPYDTFRLCGDNPILVERRIRNIIESLVNEKDIKSNNSFFKIGFPEIWEAGLTYSGSNSPLNINLCFADTIGQAKHFYKQKISFNDFKKLEKQDWKLASSFHISNSYGQGLVWLGIKPDNIRAYYEYWETNFSSIKQIEKKDLDALLRELSASGLIILDDEAKNKIKIEIKNKNYMRLNIIPGFRLKYTYDRERLFELDESNKLIADIKNKINEGVGVIGRKVEFLK